MIPIPREPIKGSLKMGSKMLKKLIPKESFLTTPIIRGKSEINSKG
jgi:hypothetical protein